jgi:hypothetical protein
VERKGDNGFAVTATGQELSILVAGARMSLEAMRGSPDAPATATVCRRACWTISIAPARGFRRHRRRSCAAGDVKQRGARARFTSRRA